MTPKWLVGWFMGDWFTAESTVSCVLDLGDTDSILGTLIWDESDFSAICIYVYIYI